MAIEALEKAKEFILIKMLKAILNPKKTTIKADIKVQLQKAFISTIAIIDLSLNNPFCTIKAIEAICNS
jgi:hypothetical protein